MKVERVSKICQADFVEKYVVGNRPVVVTDSVGGQKSPSVWTAAYFMKQFGEASVQVYDDLFTLESVTTLRSYLDRYRGQQGRKQSIPYVRWYTQFKSIDFVWADEAFAHLRNHWTMPYFVPTSGYLLPFCPNGTQITPVSDPFPGKGLFISCAGARTRLHKDPWASDALLCQMLGEKSIVMYEPQKEFALRSNGKMVDIENPALDLFPNFRSVEPDFVDTLEAGEILFIPSGWFHHVNSLTESISITWNFVLMLRLSSFISYLLEPLSENDRSILKYFSNGTCRLSSPAQFS